MTSRHPVPENSLAIAMVELDRLERERQDFEHRRSELRATAERQAHDIRELDRALRSAWPRAIARQRRRASIEHQRSCERERRLIGEVEHEHAERVAQLARENAERRVALARLEREVVAEFHPARAALAWLTPFAAAGLVAALGFMVIHQRTPDATELAPEPAAPIAAVAEPSSEPSEDVVVSDAIAPAIEDSSPTIESEPSKPSKKPTSHKPIKKPTPVTQPLTKPNSKPIVLTGGEDPLANL
jgi:hypothetical protein